MSADWARGYLAHQKSIDDFVKSLCDENDRLRAALKEIADNPCIDPEGNSQIARTALQYQQS